jgi:hypothetical protein
LIKERTSDKIEEEEREMRNTTRLTVIVMAAAVLFPVISGCGKHTPAENNQDSLTLPQLTAEETDKGWRVLFNGINFDGWRGLGREGLPEGHWIIEGEAIKKVPSGEVPLQEDGQPLAGGDLMTIAAFTDFELMFEWKISEAGNSGIKYNVSEDMSTAFPPRFAALGFEYQILDDAKHPDAKNGENRTAAALYDLMAPEGKTLKPVGEYNTGRIVFIGNHGEHWLNGTKVLEYDLGTPEMEKRLEESKYGPIEGFMDRRSGHIALQDHTDAVWFRNIKIREIR